MTAGFEPGQRRLNGPQTTGRSYRNLSEAGHRMVVDEDVRIPMRDGVELLADVHRPAEAGRYPVLVAASPYPRQIQNLGAPMGFIEAGASDWFVPRGYVHLIVNLRGTGGSGGAFGFFDAQERRDMHDVVEWAAAQSWSDGNIGMVGISYFAMTQVEAAVERPPHLKAIMPIACTFDLYQAATHNGLCNSGFLTPFLAMIGMTSARSDSFWRSALFEALGEVLHLPGLHKRFATMNGEAALAGVREVLKLHHPAIPWDELWNAAVVEHPFRDGWWQERNLLPLLERIEVPVYLGCDWQNVPLHLPETFKALERLSGKPNVRVAMMGEHGLAWPWESLHIEALAWFDQWLKGRDTGILEGPAIRYALPGAEGWRTAESWPPAGTQVKALRLRGDGVLALDGDDMGARVMQTVGAGLGRAQPSAIDPPAVLTWDSAALGADLDMVGEIELQLEATITAPDTAWIAVLQDVAPDGRCENITAGYLRAGLRAVDEAASRPGAPALPCDRYEAVPVGERVVYRIPLVPNARRFAAGHRLRLVLTSDDQDETTPAMLGFRHASIGTSCRSIIHATSRLLLPVAG